MMNSQFAAFWRNEDGQDLIEYSLLLSFIALTAMAMLVSAGGSIKTLWTGVNSKLTSAAS
ncbi:MAG: Flp family type IVb pilin [Bryobacteraceae bacterium]